MNGNGRIPIPWSQRWRWIRQHVLPVLVFAACAIGAASMWNSLGGQPQCRGRGCRRARIELTSQVDGILAETPYRRLQLFDRVEAGEVVMRLDDRAVNAAGNTRQIAGAGQVGTRQSGRAVADRRSRSRD